MTISKKSSFLFGGLASTALVIVLAATLAMTGCSDEEAATGNSSDARLVKTVGHYNIVKFNGNVYGAPHGVAIDWRKDDLKKVPGMVAGVSVDAVEKSIRSLPPQEASLDARLIRVIGHYNVVKFDGKVYGAPHGVVIDWRKDDLEKVPGMIVGTSVVTVEMSIIGRLVSEKVSRLIEKLSHVTGRKTS